MKREEQIDAQAKAFVEEFAKEQGIDSKEVQGLGMWFKLGCSWADKNPNGSQIKWQKDEPKENGAYIATYKTSDCDASVVPLYRIGKNWETTSWDSVKQERVKAWCKLSDIEPYKEEED